MITQALYDQQHGFYSMTASRPDGDLPAMPINGTDISISVRQVFGIDSDMEVSGFSQLSEHVPEIDEAYHFDRDTTLAILAGLALPRFFNYQTAARVAACKGTLGGVRAGIANWYANEAIENIVPRYPDITELTLLGEVMQEAIPDNPYGGSPDPGAVVVQGTFADALKGVVVGGGGP